MGCHLEEAKEMAQIGFPFEDDRSVPGFEVHCCRVHEWTHSDNRPEELERVDDSEGSPSRSHLHQVFPQ